MSSLFVSRKMPVLSLSLVLCSFAMAPHAWADGGTGTAAQSAAASGAESNNYAAGDVSASGQSSGERDGLGGTQGNNNSSFSAGGSGGSSSDNTYWSLGVSPRVLMDERAAAEATAKRYAKPEQRPDPVTWSQFKGRRNGSITANSTLMRKTKGVWEVITEPLLEINPEPESMQAQSAQRRAQGLPPLPSAKRGGESIIPQVHRRATTPAPVKP